MPLISVIIPNYNHGQYLKQRIDSVLTQSCTDFEVIILDDCSTDNSRAIIEKYRCYPKIRHIFYNNKNSGSPSRQWINGISMAKGEWIWIAESDDFSNPLFLERLLECAQQNPSAGIVYCNSYKEDSSEANGFKTTAEETNSDFHTDLWNSDFLIEGVTANSCYLSRKNIILNVSSAIIRKKYFAYLYTDLKKMKYYGDWYTYICVASQADIFYCKELLNGFRRHSSSLIAQSDSGKIKVDCFRILSLLLKQQKVDCSATIQYFTVTYLGTQLKKDGLISFLKKTASYFLINPFLAIRITGRTLQSKLFKKH